MPKYFMVYHVYTVEGFTQVRPRLKGHAYSREKIMLLQCVKML